MTAAQNKHIAYWLFAICFILFGMIVLGGVTRLTGSGLSMVQWRPIMGVLPPLNAEQWAATFDLYRATPEFSQVNQSMSLVGFKSIFWFEYLHRLLGRCIGLAFFLPMVYFFWRYPLSVALRFKLVGLFLLGGAQGLLGWYMVKSGLVGNPEVSQYRLVAHLSLALALYGAIWWIAIGLILAEFKPRYRLPKRYIVSCLVLVGGVFITALAGGFVAGTKAGYAFNTFPLMNGRWWPEGYWALAPGWVNFFENIASVQFNHRVLATLTGLGGLALAIKALHYPLAPAHRLSFKLLMLAIVVQYALGLATLLLHVPIPIAALHQGAAVLLLSACLVASRLCFAGEAAR